MDGRAVGRRTLEIAGAGAVFAATLAGSAVAHLDLPASRRLIARVANEALASALQGSVRVDALGEVVLSRGRISGVDVTVRDPEGVVVIVVKGASVQLSPRALVASLGGAGPLRLSMSRVRIDGAEVVLRDDASGETSLAKTFSSRVPSAPGSPAGKGVSLSIDQLSVAHVWAHGAVGPTPVDADADALTGSLRVEPDQVSATVRSVTLHARALPIPAGAAEATASAALSMAIGSGTSPTRAEATADVGAGGVHATARARLDGDEIEARVEIPRTEATALSALVSGLPLSAPIAGAIDLRGTLKRPMLAGRLDVGAGHVDLAGAAQLGETEEATLTATIVHLSLPDVVRDAPAGVVDGRVEATARRGAEGALRIAYVLGTSATTIAGQLVPAATARGDFDGERLVGEAIVDEPGAPTTVAFSLAPEPGRPGVRGLDLDVHTSAPSLAGVDRLGEARRGLRGEVTARVKGHVTLDEAMAIRGDVHATSRGVRAGGATVAGAELTAKIRGTARAPEVEASVGLSSARAGGLDIAHATVGLTGATSSPRVTVQAATREGDRITASRSTAPARWHGTSRRPCSATVRASASASRPCGPAARCRSMAWRWKATRARSTRACSAGREA
jgi:hypothetical protein